MPHSSLHATKQERCLIFITCLSCYAPPVCRPLVFLSAQIHRESNNWLCDKTTSARFIFIRDWNIVHCPYSQANAPKVSGLDERGDMGEDRKSLVVVPLEGARLNSWTKDHVQNFTRDCDHIPQSESFQTWVCNAWPVRFYYAAHGHICKLCVYYKNCAIIWAVGILPRAAREPTHNNGRGPLPYKVWVSML